MSTPLPRGSTETTEVHDLAALPRACLADWLALFADRSDAGFQHHPAWFRAIDAHLLPGALRVGVARGDDGPLAVLVLASGARERVARHPRHAHLPLGDVVLHPSLDGTAAARRVVIDLLGTMAPRAEVWRIADVPGSSGLLRALDTPRDDARRSDEGDRRERTDESGSPGAAVAPPGWSRRPSRASLHFDLTGETSVVPGKLRRNLARLRRRLADEGTLRVERVRERDALGAAWERFLDVEASGWKGMEGAGTAIRDDPALRGFYEALLDADGTSGTGLVPVIDLLWLDERCIAAQLGLEANGRLSLLKIGYDERHAACAPGSLLLEAVLGQARDDGLHTLSLVTAPAWAERWHPVRRTLWHAVRYTDSIGGYRRRALDGLEDAVRRRRRG